MKGHKFGIRAFWALAIAVPMMACLIAVLQFPPETIVPTHWGIKGEADGWNTPWIVLPVGMLVSGAQALLAISYLHSDKLYDLGLVHGVSRESARPFLVGFATFMALVAVAVFIYWVVRARAAI